MKITKRATNLGNSVFIFHIQHQCDNSFWNKFSYSSLLYILEMIYILLRNYWRYIYLRWSAGDCSIPLVFCWCLAVSYFIIIILLSFSHLLGTQIRFILYLDFCLFFFLFSLSLSLSFFIFGLLYFRHQKIRLFT